MGPLADRCFIEETTREPTFADNSQMGTMLGIALLERVRMTVVAPALNGGPVEFICSLARGLSTHNS